MKKAASLIALLTIIQAFWGFRPATGQSSAGNLILLDRQGHPITTMTDGDILSFKLSLSQKTDSAAKVAFRLSGSQIILSECSLTRGATGCEAGPLSALGWFWAQDGNSRKIVTIEAIIDGIRSIESAPVAVSPRPVVMVHGFSSSWDAWKNYLGPQGYLASIGIRGFAVGDNQVEGTMNTGRLDRPKERTNTIAENAAILGTYIENVKRVTGAQKVDLLAHSMGGLIARYYIDRLMKDDVAQLIMLGSPMAGTQCADLPASLGFYLPAALEIQPSYVNGVFNQQITHRHGIAFYALAGDPISEAIKSPCTAVPTDLAVSFESVTAIPLNARKMPVLHMNLNISKDVFEQFVRPLLQGSDGSFVFEPDPALPATGFKSLQFSRLYHGNIPPGSSQELVIHIEPGVAVASFALFDPSRSLVTEVRGASGNGIALSPAANGLIEVNDPSALFQLGYGFNNPKPGAWKITLRATDKTPASGADYALTASFQGGATFVAQTNLLLPRVGESVRLDASLNLQGKGLPVEQAEAVARGTDGTVEKIPLTLAGDRLQGVWTPGTPGLYGIEVLVTGQLTDGVPVERVTTLTVEVQPEAISLKLPAILLIAGSCLALLVCLVILFLVLWFWRRHR